MSLKILYHSIPRLKMDYSSSSQMNTRAAPAEEEKEVGKAEGGDGVESLGVDEEGDAASEEAQIAGAE